MYRDLDYYFTQIDELEVKEMLKQNILKDSITIEDQYLDKESGGLNGKGFQKYAEIKMDIYQKFFKDYLYQQHLNYGDFVYVLYFTVAGFDDIEWDVIRWEKDKWDNEERLNPKELETNSSLTHLFWNYDEATKYMEHPHLFMKNNYLVLERGGLYFSLYDLESDKIILNEESPWSAANMKDEKELTEWIKINLHDKIAAIIE